jgi:hypothetical protein
LELGVEEAAAGERGERKMGFLGGVQTRREARLLLSESPQRLYSAKVKRRRAGGEASLAPEERERKSKAARERRRWQ